MGIQLIIMAVNIDQKLNYIQKLQKQNNQQIFCQIFKNINLQIVKKSILQSKCYIYQFRQRNTTQDLSIIINQNTNFNCLKIIEDYNNIKKLIEQLNHYFQRKYNCIGNSKLKVINRNLQLKVQADFSTTRKNTYSTHNNQSQMQLEHKTITFSSLKQPQYQYQPQLIEKISQNNNLQMCYKNNPDDCFVQLVERIFSDRYLYEHKSFRDKVLQNQKGYVHIQQVLKQQIIQRFITQMGEQRPNYLDLLKLIHRLSNKLISNRQHIRRKNLFENKIKYSKPLYIEEYPQNDGNEELQTILENSTYIYKIKYNHRQNWATVYAQNPNKVVQLQGHFWSIKTYFRVINYQKSRQTFDSPNIQGMVDILKIFRHNMFQIRRQNKIKQKTFDMKNKQSYSELRNLHQMMKYNQMIEDDEMIDQQDMDRMLCRFKQQIGGRRYNQQYFENQQKIWKQKEKLEQNRIKQKQIHLLPNEELNEMLLMSYQGIDSARNNFSEIQRNGNYIKSTQTAKQLHNVKRLSQQNQRLIDIWLQQFFQQINNKSAKNEINNKNSANNQINQNNSQINQINSQVNQNNRQINPYLNKSNFTQYDNIKLMELQ